MTGFWDLEAEAFDIAIGRVIPTGPVRFTTAGHAAQTGRLWWTFRCEKLRLLACVARGEREYVR